MRLFVAVVSVIMLSPQLTLAQDRLFGVIAPVEFSEAIRQSLEMHGKSAMTAYPPQRDDCAPIVANLENQISAGAQDFIVDVSGYCRSDVSRVFLDALGGSGHVTFVGGNYSGGELAFLREHPDQFSVLGAGNVDFDQLQSSIDAVNAISGLTVDGGGKATVVGCYPTYAFAAFCPDAVGTDPASLVESSVQIALQFAAGNKGQVDTPYGVFDLSIFSVMPSSPQIFVNGSVWAHMSSMNPSIDRTDLIAKLTALCPSCAAQTDFCEKSCPSECNNDCEKCGIDKSGFGCSKKSIILP